MSPVVQPQGFTPLNTCPLLRAFQAAHARTTRNMICRTGRARQVSESGRPYRSSRLIPSALSTYVSQIGSDVPFFIL